MFYKTIQNSSFLGTQCDSNQIKVVIVAKDVINLYLVIVDRPQEKYLFLKEDDVFSLKLNGNFHGLKYYFLLYRHNQIQACADPYCYACEYEKITDQTTNKVLDYVSVFVDFSKTCNILSYKTTFQKRKQPLIMEASIRDISSSLDIQPKGSFSSIINADAFNYYLFNFGYSHIQLLPISAFANDKFDVDGYNWGYNPLLYLSLHPKYAQNGLASVNEFKNLINHFHKNNIGVVVDLVLNHVFDAMNNPLNILIPDYYYLMKDHKTLTNYSGCGNDIDSKKELVIFLYEKIIRMFIEIYDVDGFRFDLMGNLDLNTVNHLYAYSKRLKKSVLFYGEGWDMIHNKKGLQYAVISNSSKTKAGFFNDYFREQLSTILSYPNNEVLLQMLNGSPQYIKSFSINYYACHDGLSFYDHLVLGKNKTLNIQEKYQLLLSFLLLSKGHSLIMLGDTFYRTKYGHTNTYNEGDHINRIPYENLDSEGSLVNRRLLSALCILREKMDIAHNFYTYYQKNHFILKSNKIYRIIINNGDLYTHHILSNYRMIFDGKTIIRKNKFNHQKSMKNIGIYIFVEE